jgi:ribosomal protein L32
MTAPECRWAKPTPTFDDMGWHQDRHDKPGETGAEEGGEMKMQHRVCGVCGGTAQMTSGEAGPLYE